MATTIYLYPVSDGTFRPLFGRENGATFSNQEPIGNSAEYVDDSIAPVNYDDGSGFLTWSTLDQAPGIPWTFKLPTFAELGLDESASVLSARIQWRARKSAVGGFGSAMIPVMYHPDYGIKQGQGRSLTTSYVTRNDIFTPPWAWSAHDFDTGKYELGMLWSLTAGAGRPSLTGLALILEVTLDIPPSKWYTASLTSISWDAGEELVASTWEGNVLSSTSWGIDSYVSDPTQWNPSTALTGAWSIEP